MRAPPPKRAGVELKLNGCTSSSAFSKLSKPLSKDQGSGGVVLSSSASSTKRKATSALDEIMKAEERRLEKEQRVDYWLVKGIAVKVSVLYPHTKTVSKHTDIPDTRRGKK